MGFTKLKTLEIIGGMPYLDISFTKHFSLEELYCDDRILLETVFKCLFRVPGGVTSVRSC